MEKNEMGGACSTYGREERCIQRLVGIMRESDHLGDPVSDFYKFLDCIR